MAEINAKQYKAIELKYEGEGYQTIAKTIRVPLDTIKGWFESGGILAESYENYTTNMNELREKAAAGVLMRNVATASNMMVALMGSEKDEIKFRAAKEILDRVIGEPQPPVEQSNKPDGSYERHLKEAREYIKEKNEELTALFTRLGEQMKMTGHADDKRVQETIGEIRGKVISPWV
ncbi:MAG: hypothetical protein HYS74_02425 [Parcubacteria group bacterium]|nr:hypothetical protein [Parcubacteria group bacterium]